MSTHSSLRPELTIIVVSYNTKEMTLDCLRSIKSQTISNYEVIVIDNASKDGSADAIAAEFPEFVFIKSQTNHGFAKANNLAAQKARGKYLLLLNPDTVVLDGAIDKLLEFAHQRPEAKIWGGRTLYGDRSLNPTNCWRRMTMWGLTSQVLGLNSIFRNSEFFNSENYGGWQRQDEREVDIVTGCLLLIERSFWERLGGFDLTYHMYGEEADLCLRARKLGARPRVTPNAEIVHYKGASEVVRADKMVRLMRGKITLIEDHFGPFTRPFAHSLFRLWPLSRKIYCFMLGRVDASKTWGEVWRRRNEWRSGWPRTVPAMVRQDNEG
ncbi:MAG: glycosyltransferase family 2 protein [Pseudomonadota bacterium]